MPNEVLIVTGPTASGKSQFATDLAKEIEGEIINCDSVQFYKDLPILSALPTKEQRAIVPHHLYGTLDVLQNYTVDKWLTEVISLIRKLHEKGVVAIIVGGNGFYIKSLMEGLSEVPDVPEEFFLKEEKETMEMGLDKAMEYLLSIDPDHVKYLKPNDKQRILRAMAVYRYTGRTITNWWKEPKKQIANFEYKLYVRQLDREKLYDNCMKRFYQMIEQGAVEEVRNFIDKYGDNISEKNTIAKTIGLREIRSYLKGEISLEKAIETAIKNTRRYAKRQLTWMNNQWENFYSV